MGQITWVAAPVLIEAVDKAILEINKKSKGQVVITNDPPPIIYKAQPMSAQSLEPYIEPRKKDTRGWTKNLRHK